MSRGEDVLQACVACTAPTTSPQGSIGVASCRAPCPSTTQTTANGLACECKAGYTGQPESCVACGEGTYKFLPGGAACNPCPVAIGATSLTMCTFMCPAVTYKTVPRVDTVQTCGTHRNEVCPVTMSSYHSSAGHAASNLRVLMGM